MESPNRGRLALAIFIIAICSLWLTADGDTEPGDIKVGTTDDRAATDAPVAGQRSLPARQSVAVETLNRTPVLGD
jgi:hypothetical protein